MVSRTFCLSALLLSEDTGEDAPEVLRRLVIELLKQVDENVQTHKIAFEPLRDKEVRQVLKPSGWNSKKKEDQRRQVDLVRTIATQVMLKSGWVFFHFDGDCPWSSREKDGNIKKFHKNVWERVQIMIEMKLTGAIRDKQSISQAVAQKMGRLKTVVPFYSIEAWIFQNTQEATRLCEEFYGGRDVEQFENWAKDRTALDEVPKPKEKVCLGAAHNLDLACAGFPSREVYAAGKSFAAVVKALNQDTELREALAQTYSFG